MSPHTLSLELSPAEARRVRWRSSTVQSAALDTPDHPLWVACAWDQQPWGGLVERCDERLSGSLSRQQQSGRLSLVWGEVTLVGAAHRLAGAHLLLLGLGLPEALEPAAARVLGRDTADRIHMLGHTHYALEVPWVPEAAESPATRAAALAADFVATHLRRRLELLGPTEALSVTWVLPENVQLVSGSRTRRTGAGLARRSSRWARRHHRLPRVAFFKRRRKK